MSTRGGKAKSTEGILAEDANVESSPTLAMSEAELQFEAFREQCWKVVGLFGSIFSFPLVLMIAAAHGVRTGIIVTLRKTLSMLESWEGVE